jgi:predicted aldo/keto reductase-like oxidoreductase
MPRKAERNFERREFPGTVLAGAAAAATDNLPRPAETRKGGMLYRGFSKTGETVSVTGVDGSHIGQAFSEDLATRVVRTAIGYGINFMDNSWDYNNGNGQAEIRMGKALRDSYRQKVFLMTKVDGRAKEAAAKQLDESLKRLRTDHADRLRAVKNFKPMTHAESSAVTSKAKQAAMTGKYELFKTTSHFGATAKNPVWLG